MVWSPVEDEPNECSRKQPRHHPWKDAQAESGISKGDSPSVSLLQGHKRAVWQQMWVNGVLDEAKLRMCGMCERLRLGGGLMS
jgi:hypothetical protein